MKNPKPPTDFSELHENMKSPYYHENYFYIDETRILRAIPLNYRKIKPLLVAKAIVKYLKGGK